MRITQSFLSALGLIVMLVVFIVVVSQVNKQPASKYQPNKARESIVEPPETNLNLWFATTEDKKYVIKTYNISSKQTETKFTIRSPIALLDILGFGPSGKIFGLMVGPDEFSGIIATISNSGQVNPVGESFTFASKPILSPDGQKVLYVTFSNDERDFGFKIKERNIITEVTSTLASSGSAISSPRYCFDNDICYIDQQKNDFLIVEQSSDGKASAIQYQSAVPIVEWTALKDWLITVEKTTKNDYRIVSLEQTQSKIIETFPHYVKQIVPIKVDDKLAIAIIKVDQQADAAGELILFDVDSKTSTAIAENVSFVIGWEKV